MTVFTKRIILGTLSAFFISSPSLAKTPGAEKFYWNPVKVAQLTNEEIFQLDGSGCLVTSYRDQNDPDYRKIVSGKPDEKDYLVLARGEFAVRGQKDLQVLCMSVSTKKEYFHIVWGGSKKCASVINFNEISSFWKERDSTDDHYGSLLKVKGPSETRKSLAQLRKKPSDEEAKDQELQGTKYWVRSERLMPRLDHDSFFLYGGSNTFAFYCDGVKWRKLYDYYTEGGD